jgi:hypothetical protein
LLLSVQVETVSVLAGGQLLEDWGTKTILALLREIRTLLLLALPPQTNPVALISLLHALCLVAGESVVVFQAPAAYLWAGRTPAMEAVTGEDPHPITV